MALWEFTLAYDDGTVLGQTALGDGADEATAAVSAARAEKRASASTWWRRLLARFGSDRR